MEYTANCKIIEILELSDEKLIELSNKSVLSLSFEEMKKIQGYFRKLKRNPTDVEIETIAQTWSEHCKHKTLTGVVDYTELIPLKKGSFDKLPVSSRNKIEFLKDDKDYVQYEKKERTYNNLLEETIFKATKELNKKWCLSVFKDNAGVIEFDSENAVAFKVETHNHPSALEPYGGAATGVGGVIRDILGVGLGAKPLANTDVFCFGDPNISDSKVPYGIHHPKRIAKGVVAGVRDYGNRMGIPIVNGAVYFDDGYVANPLVYCGTMGILPKNKIEKKVIFGDLILLVGGRTGRDGIHGATFSSVKLDKKSDVNAVQIGNPIVEKKVLDAMLEARDLNLFRAVTDCGAGGLSSAIGELGEKIGARICLDKVPLKYFGLSPWEIWISEAQERMIFAVPLGKKDKIIEIFKRENVEATVVGEFTNDNRLVVLYDNNIVANLDMEFLHNGVPKPVRSAIHKIKEEKIQESIKMNYLEISQTLKVLLADLNVCSREWIIRQYDHEVQGQTIVKPLQGNCIEISGPSDAAVIFPYTIIKDTKKGIVLSNGFNPEYGKINVYKMACSSIEEALRNAVSVGGNIEKISLLDNFCWGNTNSPEVLGSLVCVANACYDMSKAFDVPFISGKDSLHNEYSTSDGKYSIPPALLISAMGVIDDVANTVTMSFKNTGNKIFLLGVTRNELGASVLAKIKNIRIGIVPAVYPNESKEIMKKIYLAINENVVESCHDCSEGGLAVAISEMAFSAKKGVQIYVDSVKTETNMLTMSETLFSESNGRFIVEVTHENETKFREVLKGSIFSEIGCVTDDENIIFESEKNKLKLQENSQDLLKIWQSTINW
ncbi:MAG: phosphoribosylformylglycinamidine synthase subunit PurL [Endomicrobium sp.]|jgi:phosphoribosylformylglycinamidine synthase|nr:phosphoribosylformylglycinamidine synthase subunit PurL [Endomicrobium sp.]